MDTAGLQAWIPTLAAGSAIALLWWDMRSTKSKVIARAEELERVFSKKVDELSDTLKHSLYRADGQTNYILRNECEREQTRCRATLCSKIDAQTAILSAMDAKRDQQREAIFQELKQIAGQVGNLAGQIESQKGGIYHD